MRLSIIPVKELFAAKSDDAKHVMLARLGGGAPNDLCRVVIWGPVPAMGKPVVALGNWKTSDQFGRQFAAKAILPSLLTEPLTVAQWLERPSLKFLSAANRTAILTAIPNLSLIPTAKPPLGVTAKHWSRLRNNYGYWRMQEDERTVLQHLGVRDEWAERLTEHYSYRLLSTLTGNPFQIVQDFPEFPFSEIDRIAIACGARIKPEQRYQAALVASTSVDAKNGHTAVDIDTLKDLGGKVMGKTEVDYLDYVDNHAGKVLVPVTPKLYAESQTARRMEQISEDIGRLLDGVRPVAANSRAPLPDYLNAKQRRAALLPLSSGITIVTGGPGVGKTTVMKAMADQLEAAGITRIKLGAPYGKAARRMNEATGRQADTVHGLFEARLDLGFTVNADNQLDCDVLILDEQSTQDEESFAGILRGLGTGTRLVLVGDVDQLPSVGAGNVLEDLIASGVIPTVRLTELYRQKEGSHLAVNAHRINAGLMPLIESDSADFHFHAAVTDAAIASDLEAVIASLINNHKVKPDDIQVLSPQRVNTLLGSEQLNRRLAPLLNPDRPSDPLPLEVAGRSYRLRDRVMLTKNYRKDKLNNGDIGLVTGINLGARALTVNFDGRSRTFTGNELYDLNHSFAKTVHKSQGSEYPIVLMPVSPSHQRMLFKRLVYTATTRAKQQMYMIGDADTMARGIARDVQDKRRTALCDILRRDHAHRFGRTADGMELAG